MMNYNCMLGGSNKYERFSDNESILECPVDELDSAIKEVKIDFYNDDGSFQSIVVEENLRTSDLCQLLALKNHVAKDVNWAVVEYIEDLGLERSLEDHEEVLKVYLRWQMSKKFPGNKFFFRKDFRKYEILRNPQQFFPLEMIDCDSQIECLSESPDVGKIITLERILNTKDEPPKIFGNMWIQKSRHQLWKKAFFLLENKILYYSLISKALDPSNMSFCADIQDYDIYTFTKSDKNFRVPTEFCLCLKTTVHVPNDEYEDIFFSCDNEKMRMCWIAGLRLAKYGKQLRDNFRNFKQKENEVSNSSTEKDYSSLKVSNDSTRTRVAMDFTGNHGKIIDDPKEAQLIAIAEGCSWSKKLFRSTCRTATSCSLKGLTSGIHITQPWFHNDLTRNDTIQLLTKYGTVNGVFLVRESLSQNNAFVLSFVYSEKVYHTRVLPIEENDQTLVTIDNGKTKFYDLLQLVEFHQLNLGCLPTKLTHYIAQTTDGLKTCNQVN